MKVYLDYNATTPLDPAVLLAMKPYWTDEWGNASSFHRKGQQARGAVETARESIAESLQCEPGDVIFTSGGTESANLAVRGTIMAKLTERRHLVVTAIEHSCVLQTARHLEKRGVRVSVVPCGSGGVLDVDALRAAVDRETALVSVMHVNNELGTEQPVREAARVAHAAGALLHVDAVQSFGKLGTDVGELGCDLLSLSAHKINGPKGAGALYIRKGVKLEPILHGGHQEKNIRPGTENVPAIVGLGQAAALCRRLASEESVRVRYLRDRLESELLRRVAGTRVNGDTQRRMPHVSSLSFSGIDGETLLMNLDLVDIYVSTGSACTAGSVEPSHVLQAIGLDERECRSTVRFSLGRFTTDAEIDHALATLPPIIERLRKSSAR